MKPVRWKQKAQHDPNQVPIIIQPKKWPKLKRGIEGLTKAENYKIRKVGPGNYTIDYYNRNPS